MPGLAAIDALFNCGPAVFQAVLQRPALLPAHVHAGLRAAA